MPYQHTLGQLTYRFRDLKDLMAKATPKRSGDELAGTAARSHEERIAAQWALADLPLTAFLQEALIPYEHDEVTRLIVDSHSLDAFQRIAHLTVGGFRDWLLLDSTDSLTLAALAPGLTPEMVAAVSKIMRLQDLIRVAAKCQVTSAFRNTLGLPGHFSSRLQPNHPTDSPAGVAASILDGLLMGSGDAVIGINPVSDSLQAQEQLLKLLDELIQRFDIPTQSCVLTHVTNAMEALNREWPVDLVFQSIAGTQAANESFGIHLDLLKEAHEGALALKRGSVGQNVMYFETGQGSCLSADAHFGVDQQTLEARAYAVARAFDPLLVNTVVGFIGPEYLYDGKQIIRAGLEDHFCGKLLGLPMGCDICYTNHAEADQDDMDSLLVQFVAAGGTFVMGIPGSDDIMLNYQSTSFHDIAGARALFNKRPAPEFDAWLQRIGLSDDKGQLSANGQWPDTFKNALAVETNPWPALQQHTSARIGLGRSGQAIPTPAHLQFQQDHGLAKDAIHEPLNLEKLEADLAAVGEQCWRVHSAANSRSTYLKRPDLGRQLNPADRQQLIEHAEGTGNWDGVLVIADGLSATGIQQHGLDLACQLLSTFRESGWKMAPVILASQARVALGDDIGAALGVRFCVMMIGERPGLSAADSLGLYLTYNPRPGRSDAERNCISNIRPGGMSFDEAATTCDYLLRQAVRYQVSGTRIKDDRSVLDVSDNSRAIPFLKAATDNKETKALK